MGLPFIFMPAGAMLRGNYAGQKLGSGTDVWKYWDERRAGTIDDKTWFAIEDGIARSPGTCMTMGTASTMMSIAEGFGLTLPGASSIPAPDAGHKRMATFVPVQLSQQTRVVDAEANPGELSSAISNIFLTSHSSVTAAR